MPYAERPQSAEALPGGLHAVGRGHLHATKGETNKVRRSRRLAALVGALALGVASTTLLPSPAEGATVSGTNVLYTTDGDFDQGTLVNVNHDAPNNNQLQLN